MSLSEWLDIKEAEGVDVSRIELPEDLLYDAVLDEIANFLGKPVTVLPIGKSEYDETLILQRDGKEKLQALREEIEQADKRGTKRKKGRR